MRLARNFHFAFRLRINIPHLPPLAIFLHPFPSQTKLRIGFDLRYVPLRKMTGCQGPVKNPRSGYLPTFKFLIFSS
jgi:hypothetical protein